MSIVEQVRVGLEEKIEGINTALSFVRDPREIDRLNKDLKGAVLALEKLNKPDTRSDVELKQLEKMINDKVDVEASPKGWSTLSPVEKFKYQVDLYCKKLDEAYVSAKAQHETLNKVVNLFSTIDFKEHDYMESIYAQFMKSLKEVEFSIKMLDEQLSLKDKALKVIDDSFDTLVFVNRFLNNPMSMPHLSEERDAKLAEVRNGGAK